VSTSFVTGAAIAIRFSLATAALALPLLAATPAKGEIIPAERMSRGITMTPTQCAAQPQAVWVTVSKQGFCIRYYVSTEGGQGKVPVVFLQGDRMGSYNRKTRKFAKVNKDQDIDTDTLETMAKILSMQAKTTAIYLARVGVEGSSGHHGERWSWLELYVLNSALDAIKQRHGYTGFHLAGQSGGGSLVGGMLIVRSDIGCAVPGAGGLSLLGANVPRGTPALLRKFDPTDHVKVIARLRQTRILVVTDPQDKYVPLREQTTFVQALLRAGGRVEQFYVQATDEGHHGVRVYTFAAVAACVQGKTNPQIVAILGKLQERHLAAAEERRTRQANGGRQQHAAGPTQRTGGQPAAPAPVQPAARPPAAPAPVQHAGRPTAAQPAANPPRQIQRHAQRQQLPHIRPAQVAFSRILPSARL
jgi:hypothetical protein